MAAMVTASASYWGVRCFLQERPLPMAAEAYLSESLPEMEPQQLALLLGAQQTGQLQRRLSLLGVVTQAGGRGVALLSVEGRPVKPYRVGSQVGPGLVLQSLAPRRAMLAASLEGPVLMTLDLPARAP